MPKTLTLKSKMDTRTIRQVSIARLPTSICVIWAIWFSAMPINSGALSWSNNPWSLKCFDQLDDANSIDSSAFEAYTPLQTIKSQTTFKGAFI